MITTFFNDKEQILNKDQLISALENGRLKYSDEAVMEDIRYFRTCGKHLQANVVEECFQIYLKIKEEYKMKTNTIVTEV